MLPSAPGVHSWSPNPAILAWFALRDWEPGEQAWPTDVGNRQWSLWPPGVTLSFVMYIITSPTISTNASPAWFPAVSLVLLDFQYLFKQFLVSILDAITTIHLGLRFQVQGAYVILIYFKFCLSSAWPEVAKMFMRSISGPKASEFTIGHGKPSTTQSPCFFF